MQTNSGQQTKLGDTDLDAEQVQIRIIRRTPVWKKFRQIAELNHTCRLLALADIHRRHPHADENEVRHLLAMRLLTPELVAQIYGVKGRLKAERVAED